MAVGVVATYNGSYHSPGFDITVSGVSGYNALTIERIDVLGQYSDTPVRGADNVPITDSLYSVTDYEAPAGRSFVYRATATSDSTTDNFTRTTVNGWGGSWVVATGPVAQFSTNGTVGAIELNAIDTTFTVVQSDVSIQNVDLVGGMFLNLTPTGNFLRGRAYLRYVDGGNFIALNVNVFPTGIVDLQIVRFSNGVGSVLGSATGVTTHQAGVSLQMRFQAMGGALQARVWRANVSEPATWHITAVDPVPTVGAVAVGALLGPGNTNTQPVRVTFDGIVTSAIGSEAVRTSVGTSSNIGVQDTFNRAATTNGWGPPDLGANWVVRSGLAGDFSATGSVGRMAMTQRSNPEEAFGLEYVMGVPLTHTDIDQKVRFRIPVAPSNDVMRTYMVARETDRRNWWQFEVSSEAAGPMRVRFSRAINGQQWFTAGPVVSGLTYTPGAWYWMRFQAVGNQLRGKVWKDGTVEPVGWHMELTDNSNPSGSFLGVKAFASVFSTNPTPEVVEFDDYSAVILDTSTVIPVDGPGTAWMKSVGQPALSRRVNISKFSQHTRPGRILGEYQVLGRSNKVVLRDTLGGREGSLILTTFPMGGVWESDSSWRNVQTLLEYGGTLLLQTAGEAVTGEDDMYLEIKDVSRERVGVVGGELVHLFQIDFIEVDRPASSSESLALRDWQDVLDQNLSWQGVLDNHSTWLDVLQRDL